MIPYIIALWVKIQEALVSKVEAHEFWPSIRSALRSYANRLKHILRGMTSGCLRSFEEGYSGAAKNRMGWKWKDAARALAFVLEIRSTELHWLLFLLLFALPRCLRVNCKRTRLGLWVCHFNVTGAVRCCINEYPDYRCDRAS